MKDLKQQLEAVGDRMAQKHCEKWCDGVMATGQLSGFTRWIQRRYSDYSGDG